ncbi:hypothetical protein CVIRNUC_004717 [Coccomyxa viridis]|uniref:Sulfotransferase n=1 Tax=Coccomyxa viridis TaxID=1274662 RepID=A0AAV1I5M2_9CHLO|nr:hypothetical protein CVIRNUC_004717 [Coccomyxa viridis]
MPLPDRGKVIIAAGPERSGSTWLFNAIRLLCQDSQEPLHPYWITSLTDAKLQERGAGTANHPHILIKTHRWSSRWRHHTADHIFLTHRDLRGVLASYQRVGWAFDIDRTYVQEHMAWKDIAQHDFAFEDVVSRPAHQLEILAQELDLHPKWVGRSSGAHQCPEASKWRAPQPSDKAVAAPPQQRRARSAAGRWPGARE